MDKLFKKLFDYIVKNAVNLSLFIALLCFATVFYVRYELIFLQIGDIGGIEQNFIYSIQRLLAGFNLYDDSTLPPYSLNLYSPLYYYLNAFLGKLFNINPDKPFEVFMLSRSVSLSLNILLLGVIFIILKNIYKIESKIAIITCVFVFLYLERHIYSRVDSLYSLSFLTTIFLFLLYLKATGGRKSLFLILSSVSSVLTIYSKQSGILLPILIFFFLIFYSRNKKDIVIVSLSMIASFFLLLILTAGDDINVFFQNVYGGLHTGISVKWFYKEFIFSYYKGIIIWTIFGFTTALIFLKTESELSLKFLSVSMFATFIFALATGLKWGATPSYLTEYLNIMFITLTIFLFTRHINFNEHKIKVIYFLVVLFILPYLALNHIWVYNVHYKANASGISNSEKVYQYVYIEQKLKSSDLVLIMGDSPLYRQFLDNYFYRNNVLPHKNSFNWKMGAPYDISHFIKNANNGLIKYLIIHKKSGEKIYHGLKFTNFEHLKNIGNLSIFIYSNKIKREIDSKS